MVERKNKSHYIQDLLEIIRCDYPFCHSINTQRILDIFATVTKYVSKGKKLLDIGCGSCSIVAAISNADYECHACDDFQDPWHLDDDNYKKIKRYAEINNISLTKMDLSEGLPYSDFSFDAVLLIDVLEHLHNSPKKILAEMSRVLKPGGYVFIGTPNSANLRKRIHLLLGGTNYPSLEQFYFSGDKWRGHIREYTPDEVLWLLSAGNFELIELKMCHWMLENRISGIKKILYFLVTTVISKAKDSILVVGQKC